MNEIWKPIPGAIRQEVSNLGRIRHYCIGNPPYALTKFKMFQGCPHFNMRRSDIPNRYSTTRVDVVVMRAFVGEKPDGYRIIHKDGDPTNCELSNLEYAPLKKTQRRQYIQSREGFKGSKLTPNSLREIRDLISQGVLSYGKIAKQYGVHTSYISLIARGKRCADVE